MVVAGKQFDMRIPGVVSPFNVQQILLRFTISNGTESAPCTGVKLLVTSVEKSIYFR